MSSFFFSLSLSSFFKLHMSHEMSHELIRVISVGFFPYTDLKKEKNACAEHI